jgi:hypothetical protein
MGDYQETLADASSRSHPGLGSCAGMIGTGRWKAAGGGHGCGDGQQGTVVPGVERAPGPVRVLRVRKVETLSGSVSQARVCAGGAVGRP